MRRDVEFFGETDLDLLYMARTLRAALRLEDILAAAGVDYLIETGTYTAGWLMRRELTGAFFYVLPADLSRARQILVENRYKPYSVNDEAAPEGR